MSLVRPREFTCQAMVDHGQAVVEVTGELDLSTARHLSERLSDVLEHRPRELTLDLTGLEFIDSTGLTLLVRTSKRLETHGGALRLSRPTPAVRRVLEIVGLTGLLVD